MNKVGEKSFSFLKSNFFLDSKGKNIKELVKQVEITTSSLILHQGTGPVYPASKVPKEDIFSMKNPRNELSSIYRFLGGAVKSNHPLMLKNIIPLPNFVSLSSNLTASLLMANAVTEEDAGGIVLDSAIEVAKNVDLLVKVKEPVEEEYHLLSVLKNKILFTYLHLAAAPKSLTLNLIENKITSIAYETVEDENGKLPLLTPMSEIAGVLAVQYGAQFLQKKYGGLGVTLGKITNTPSANVLVVGAGIVGSKAALTAAGMGCNVTILEKNLARLEQLKKEFKLYLGENLFKNVSFVESTPKNLAEEIKNTDLLIGAVLIKGAKAPQVVTREHVYSMKRGVLIVDVAIDQGGCVWGSMPTTHDKPIFEIDGKIYCCVANMPGQVALQSTRALSAATMPYIIKMAELGVLGLIKKDAGFAKGLNVYDGKIVYASVAEALGLEYKESILVK